MVGERVVLSMSSNADHAVAEGLPRRARPSHYHQRLASVNVDRVLRRDPQIRLEVSVGMIVSLVRACTVVTEIERGGGVRPVIRSPNLLAGGDRTISECVGNAFPCLT